MVTEVIMKRELFGKEISQRSKSEFFSATDLVKAGNQWRILNGKEFFKLTTWLASKHTKEFIEELEKEFGKVIIRSKGKNQHTWIHPYLFIDLSLTIDPKLKIEVYRWIYDSLLKYRNDSGDSFKKMSGALFIKSKNKSFFPKEIKEYCIVIKKACKVDSWETATENQLTLRNRIHDNIALLTDLVPNDSAVRLGIKKALEYDIKEIKC